MNPRETRRSWRRGLLGVGLVLTLARLGSPVEAYDRPDVRALVHQVIHANDLKVGRALDVLKRHGYLRPQPGEFVERLRASPDAEVREAVRVLEEARIFVQAGLDRPGEPGRPESNPRAHRGHGP